MKMLNIFKNKNGETWLPTVIKIVITCILSVLVLTFAYFVIEENFVNETIKNQNKIYHTEVKTENQNQSNRFEVVHKTTNEE